MTTFLHTMVRITDPERSRAFYTALGFQPGREAPIVRNGELEATNYFYGLDGQPDIMELTFNQPFMVALQTAVEPRLEAVLGHLPVRLYGWRDGVIVPRGFEVIEE